MPPGSYSKINYRLRPAKATERKMICDSLRCLTPFGDIESYRYVGFGSTYFSDFILFHKWLHIEDMISIEKDRSAKDRFEYNKPFGCIDIKYGTSDEELPKIQWNSKAIVWLDYDSPLNLQVLEDIDFLIGKIYSGSVLIVTVSAEQERPSQEGLTREEINKFRRDKLEESLSGKVPTGLKPIDLTGSRLSSLYERIIINQVKQSINDLNAARSASSGLSYRQIFNFRYADGARMLTIGWLFFDDNDLDLATNCRFNKPFNIREGDEPYEIQVPNLTLKEVQYLDSKMPTTDCDSLQRICIPLKDVRRYSELYKYFPSFVEMFM